MALGSGSISGSATLVSDRYKLYTDLDLDPAFSKNVGSGSSVLGFAGSFFWIGNFFFGGGRHLVTSIKLFTAA